jgi:hypothetical protein
MTFYPPGQEITTRDGGVGIPVDGANLPLVVGPSSLGIENKAYFFQNGSSEVVSTVGRGSGAELAAALADAGGCIFLKTAASTAGSIGTVAYSRVASSTGTIAVTGTPVDALRVRVRCTKTGGAAAGKFQYALDGYSDTAAYGWSPEYTMPSAGTFTLTQSGLVIAFTGTLDAGDVARADCVAPHYTTTDLTAAFGALLAQIGTFRINRVMMAGTNQTASAAIVLAAALAGHLDTLASKFNFARSPIDGGSVDSLANFNTAKASSTDDRVALVYDPQTASAGCHIVSRVPYPGWVAPRVSAVNAVAERFAQTEISESPDRVLSGSLRGVISIGNDEGLSPQFTATDRVITLCKKDGYSGYFITKAFIHSDPTSDFRTLQWGAVIDRICTIVHDVLQQFPGSNMRALTDGTGRIYEDDALRVENAVMSRLKDEIKEPTNIEGFKGHVSDVVYKVLRTNDYLATGEILGVGTAVPLREVDGLRTTIGFSRTV